MSKLWNDLVDAFALVVGGRLWERRVHRWLDEEVRP